MTALEIHKIIHPEYERNSLSWRKWRYAYDGGRDFVNEFLKKYSAREGDNDFADRKAITYSPSFAKAAVDDVKNSIYQRIADVSRSGGTDSYQEAITGHEGGIDRCGNSMDSFIGNEILPELLPMGKVGIYVDKPPISQGSTLRDNMGKRPYIYLYQIENIRSWVKDPNDPSRYTAVLLRDFQFVIDEKTNLPTGVAEKFRYVWKDHAGVHAQMYNDEGKEESPVFDLELDTIPFVCLELTNSLMIDIADYQVALLNLASSDIGYVLKSNFPFYVEQYDPRAFGSPYLKPAGNEDVDTPGAAGTAEPAKSRELKTGITDGRAYAKDLDQPAFIHPSPEPIQASMSKQTQLKEEIRLLLNLAISNLRPVKAASAESKSFDERGLESGLSYIGLALETAERQIAEIWSQYEDSSNNATITYPKEYSLKTDAERREEAKNLLDLREQIASETYQKQISKETARILLGHKISREDLQKVSSEIETAKGRSGDSETIQIDVEMGILSKELAAELRGYPKDQVEKANEEHAERLARLAEHQGMNMENGSARGVDDLDDGPDGGKKEKEQSRDTTERDTTDDRTRGKGRS